MATFFNLDHLGKHTWEILQGNYCVLTEFDRQINPCMTVKENGSFGSCVHLPLAPQYV